MLDALKFGLTSPEIWGLVLASLAQLGLILVCYTDHNFMPSQSKKTQPNQPKYGARVFRLAGKLLVKQTILRGTPAEYVVDEQRERHVSDGDDSAIAAAIRDAVSGRL